MTSLICCKLQKGNAATGKISLWNLQVNLAQSLSKGDWRSWDSQVGKRQSQLDALKTKSSMAPKYLSKEETCSAVSPSAWGPLVSRQEHPDPVRNAYLNPKPINPVNDALNPCSWGGKMQYPCHSCSLFEVSKKLKTFIQGEKKRWHLNLFIASMSWGPPLCQAPHHCEQGKETRNKQLHV